MDYTKYPEGFEAIIKDLKMPVPDDKKKAFFIGFMDSIIKQ